MTEADHYIKFQTQFGSGIHDTKLKLGQTDRQMDQQTHCFRYDISWLYQHIDRNYLRHLKLPENSTKMLEIFPHYGAF